MYINTLHYCSKQCMPDASNSSLTLSSLRLLALIVFKPSRFIDPFLRKNDQDLNAVSNEAPSFAHFSQNIDALRYVLKELEILNSVATTAKSHVSRAFRKV